MNASFTLFMFLWQTMIMNVNLWLIFYISFSDIFLSPTTYSHLRVLLSLNNIVNKICCLVLHEICCFSLWYALTKQFIILHANILLFAYEEKKKENERDKQTDLHVHAHTEIYTQKEREILLTGYLQMQNPLKRSLRSL